MTRFVIFLHHPNQSVLVSSGQVETYNNEVDAGIERVRLGMLEEYARNVLREDLQEAMDRGYFTRVFVERVA